MLQQSNADTRKRRTETQITRRFTDGFAARLDVFRADLALLAFLWRGLVHHLLQDQNVQLPLQEINLPRCQLLFTLLQQLLMNLLLQGRFG